MSFSPFFSVNGQPDAGVAGGDRGLAYGDGLFETLLLRAGQLPFLTAHWDRLADGLEALGLSLDWNRLESDLDTFRVAVARRGIVDGVIKLTVTRGSGGRGYRPPEQGSATIMFGVFPLPEVPESNVRSGVDVYVCNHRLPDNPRLAGCKHLNKLDYVLASREWSPAHYQEALLLDGRDHVVEATSRNVFVKVDNKLLTPPLHLSGVKGVLRRLIMQRYAPALALPVVEDVLPLATVMAADEVLLCNAITGIWPVKSIAAKAVPTGPAAAALQQCLHEDIQRRIEHVA